MRPAFISLLVLVAVTASAEEAAPASLPLPAGATARLGDSPFRTTRQSAVLKFIDGNRLLDIGFDRSIRIWDVDHARLERLVPGGSDRLFRAKVSENGRFGVMASEGGALEVWDLQTFKVLSSRGDRGDPVAAVDPEGHLLARHVGQEVVVESIDGSTIKVRFEAGTEFVVDVAFSPGGDLLRWSGFDDTTWADVATGTILCRMNKGSPPVPEAAAESWKGSAWSCAANSGMEVRLYSIPSGRQLGEWDLSKYGKFPRTSISPDFKSAALGIPEETCVRLLADGKVLWETNPFGPSGRHFEFAWSSDGKRLAVRSETSSRIAVLDAATGRDLIPNDTHDSQVWSIGASSDGKSLATGDRNGLIVLWDVVSMRPTRRLQAHPYVVSQLRFSPDGAQLLSGGWDGSLCDWDVKTGVRRFEFEMTSELAAFSPDGARILFRGAHGQTRIAAAKDGSVISCFEAWTEDGLFGMCWLDNGRRLREFHANFFLDFDAATGKQLGVSLPLESCRQAVVAPDEELFFARSFEKASLNSMGTGEIVRAIELGKGRPMDGFAACFSADGRWLVASAEAGPALVEVCSGTIWRVFDGAGYAPSVCFAAGDRMIASGHQDCFAYLWDISSLRAPTPAAGDPQGAWMDLGDADPSKVACAQSILAGNPDAAAFLQGHLHCDGDRAAIRKIAERLDADDADKRDSASAELADLGPDALACLDAETRCGLSVEATTRLNSLMQEFDAPCTTSAVVLRRRRALRLLEGLDTKLAREALESLAGKLTLPREKREAAESAKRLKSAGR